MKKIIFALVCVLGVVSCSKEQIHSSSNALNFEFTVATPDSKASISKTAWISGDKIVLFFNDKAADGYVTLTYDGSKWAATPSGNIESAISQAGASGKFDAAFCADSDGSVTEVKTGANWMVGNEDSFYMSQTNGTYTFADNTVRFNVTLGLGNAGYVQVFIPGASGGDLLHVHGITRENAAYTTGLKAASCALYRTGDKADFYPAARTVNGTIKGYAREGGAAFYALNNGGSDSDFTFCLSHAGKDYYYLAADKSLAGKMSIVLPNVSSWEVDEARCVLYEDGHFVLNQYVSDDFAYAFTEYGSQVKTCAVQIEEQGKYGSLPWDSFRSSIKYVEVATAFQPKGMRNWFNGCSNLVEFNGNGIDASLISIIQNTFNGCSSMTKCETSTWSKMTALVNAEAAFSECSSIETLNFSSWGATKLQTISATFKSCEKLADLDISGWGGNLKTGTALQNTFNKCYKLKSVDLSGFNITSTVTDCRNCFYKCGNLTTIYVSSTQNWQSITSSTDMFNTCSNLVGGNGSAWATYSAGNTNVDKTYARIDKAGQVGYFTEKK